MTKPIGIIYQRECVHCGVPFDTNRRLKRYCSKRCKEKAKSIRHMHEYREKYKTKRAITKRLREARAKDNGPVDYSITLTKLIVRDNHICKLCNRLIDESDYTYKGDVFIAGNYYPSIDHIIPLSKGGTHQWNNVQLAHRICNSIKRDRNIA